MPVVLSRNCADAVKQPLYYSTVIKYTMFDGRSDGILPCRVRYPEERSGRLESLH